MSTFRTDDLFHPPHLPVHQTDLDAVRVIGRLGKDVLDDTLGEFAGSLILFQDNQNRQAGFDVRAFLSVHYWLNLSRTS